LSVVSFGASGEPVGSGSFFKARERMPSRTPSNRLETAKQFAAILPTPETTGDFEENCLAAAESAALVTARSGADSRTAPDSSRFDTSKVICWRYSTAPIDCGWRIPSYECIRLFFLQATHVVGVALGPLGLRMVHPSQEVLFAHLCEAPKNPPTAWWRRDKSSCASRPYRSLFFRRESKVVASLHTPIFPRSKPNISETLRKRGSGRMHFQKNCARWEPAIDN
jgi:hypothetical protein